MLPPAEGIFHPGSSAGHCQTRLTPLSLAFAQQGLFSFFPRTCMKLSLSSVILVQGLAKVLLGLGQPAMASVISTQMVSMGKDRHRLLHLDGKAIHSIRASATRIFPSQYRENFWGNITDILSNGPNPVQDYLPPRSSTLLRTTPSFQAIKIKPRHRGARHGLVRMEILRLYFPVMLSLTNLTGACMQKSHYRLYDRL
jgi:hypothetical protein